MQAEGGSAASELSRTRRPAGRLAARPAITNTSTVTLLFTDLARSTELYDRLGDQAAERIRRAHFERLRDAASAYEGRLVKTLGDGLMLGFGSCVKALSCAVVMQQLTSNDPGASSGQPLGLRIGVNAGEVVSDEHDYFGGAVVLASRLCGQAEPGQILVSDVVRSLVGSSGSYEFRELGPLALKGIARPQPAHELLWHSSIPELATTHSGTLASDEVAVSRDEIEELQRVLRASGLEDVTLSSRQSVVFVYPGMGIGDLHRELAGCTTQVCAIIAETSRFHEHGIQVVGLSTEPSPPPEGCSFIPFPVGVIPQEALGGVLESVDKGTRKYALRTSFVLFPDGTGVRIRNVSDVIAHVQRSFEISVSYRLETYRHLTVRHLARRPDGIRTVAEFGESLPNGADSVAISRVAVRAELVCKLADPAVIAAEAGYILRIAELLEANGSPALFPAVVAVCTDETPGWYLMEAANPVSLDRVVFEDEARTTLHPAREHLLRDALQRVAALYELTFRAEVPRIARYHYLERFRAIPRREDAAGAFAKLVGERQGLDAMLGRRMRLGDELTCRSYREQLGFLEANIESLLQPVGAYVHGDLHLPNMLLDADGEGIVFIDPRVIWDANDVGDPGFCDPMYDLATLLHSLHTASAIMRAVADGSSERLLDVNPLDGTEDTIEIAPGTLDIAGSAMVGWFLEWVRAVVPETVRGPNWESRLHIGAANALMGWLKYPGAVGTGDAWMAIFASALFHLEMGRRRLEAQPQP